MADEYEINEHFGSKEVIRSVLTNAKIGMWSIEVIDGKKPQMFIDSTLMEMTKVTGKLTPEETFESWYDHIVEEDEKTIKGTFDEIKNLNIFETEFAWEHPLKGIMYCRACGVVDKGFTEGLRIQGTYQDISDVSIIKNLFEKQKVEVEIKSKENERYSSIAKVLSQEYESIYYVNLDSENYLEFNVSGNFRKLPIDISGKNFFEECRINLKRTAYKDDFDKISEFISRDYIMNYLPVGEFRSIEYRLVISGKPTFYRIKVLRPRDNDNHLIVAVANIDKEVSETIRYQKQLQDAMYRAEEASSAKSAFLFNMSHDIRTPLNVITGFTDIAERHITDVRKVEECLDKVRRASEHLISLVNDVLDISSIESGHIEIANESMDIISCCDEVDSMVKYLAVSKGLDFNTDFNGVKNRIINGDSLHLKQVLINLITNAIKFTPEGGKVDFTVREVELEDENCSEFVFTIEDTGIGMSDTYQKHMFETFSRERTNTDSRKDGVGLGLAITKRLVDKMHGIIDVRSVVNAGTTFVVTIPMSVSEEGLIVGKNNNRKMISLDGKKALVVEDNELNREIATEVLHEAGMKVDVAVDGVDAIRKLSRIRGAKNYDVILMDIQMPYMDGYEATREIRTKIRGGREIPIIALSANAFEIDKKNAIKAGMNAHVSKPIEIQSLYETMKECMIMD